jgi:hypothetical protein
MPSMTEDELIDGLGEPVERYLDGDPDPETLLRAVGLLAAYTLATVMQTAPLAPAHMTAVVEDFCTQLRQATARMVQDAGAGPPC